MAVENLFLSLRPKQVLPAEKTVKDAQQKMEKPSVFIGCSRESLIIAEFVKAQFGNEHFDVNIWDEGIFGSTDPAENGLQNIHWLKNFTDIYDFAIFLFVPDDSIRSMTRKENDQYLNQEGTRHNVVFEFGLFLGRIGAKKTYLLFDNDTADFIDQFFTDLQDSMFESDANFIRCFSYKGNYRNWCDTGKGFPYKASSLQPAVDKIKDEMLKTAEDIEISFLPSTSLAIGYFKNFLQIIHDFYKEASKDPLPVDIAAGCEENEHLATTVALIRQSKKLRIKIVIPQLLEFANQQNCKEYFTTTYFKPVSFPGKFRPMTGNCLASRLTSDPETLVFYDMPTTLDSSAEAIKMITIHKDIRELLNEKEKRNFKKVIHHLLEEHCIKDDATVDVSFINWETFLAERSD